MKIYIVILFLIITSGINAQNNYLQDTLNIYKTKPTIRDNEKLNYKQFIAPTLMFSYGIFALNNSHLKNYNIRIQEKIINEHTLQLNNIELFSQFAPSALVFGLQACGVKGKNSIKDEALIYTISTGISTCIIYPLKYITNEMRPNNSSTTSFPSGHTARAFASAEFLRREYQDISPWYGIGGYAVAIGTGVLRMYNNKHWFSDVVAGAGIGIASTTFAYWIYDKIKFRGEKNQIVSIYPICGEYVGLGLFLSPVIL